jgi:2-keto-4-pentenoate hydratase/2-oxohepta-3-ene-1,7-dioic acid hydratase in catechol pathway
MMDYELEMALVIGRKGKDIAAKDAQKYIWGYTVFNDFSARERLIEEVMKGKVGPLKSKDFNTGNSLGPWIVTADEISNPQNLAMKVRVNGELKGEANTSEMNFSISELIQEASEGEFIIPGEIIATGAAGDGTGIESWSFLKPDDVIQLEIDEIGVLENQIIKNRC